MNKIINAEVLKKYPERPGVLGYEVTYWETYATKEFYFASSEAEAKEKMKKDIEMEKIEISRECEDTGFTAKLVAIS